MKMFYSKKKRPCKIDLTQETGFLYTPQICQQMFNSGFCPNGINCDKCHTDAERKSHPLVFKTFYCDIENCKGTKKCYWKAHYCKRDLRKPTDPLKNRYKMKPRNDQFWKYHFKIFPCKRTDCVNAFLCEGFHNSNERRRNPKLFKYEATPCPNVRQGNIWGRPYLCPKGNECDRCHSFVELMYHESVFKSHHCHRFPFCKFGVYCTHKHCPKTTEAVNRKFHQRRRKRRVPLQERSVPKMNEAHSFREARRENMSEYSTAETGFISTQVITPGGLYDGRTPGELCEYRLCLPRASEPPISTSDDWKSAFHDWKPTPPENKYLFNNSYQMGCIGMRERTYYGNENEPPEMHVSFDRPAVDPEEMQTILDLNPDYAHKSLPRMRMRLPYEMNVALQRSDDEKSADLAKDLIDEKESNEDKPSLSDPISSVESIECDAWPTISNRYGGSQEVENLTILTKHLIETEWNRFTSNRFQKNGNSIW